MHINNYRVRELLIYCVSDFAAREKSIVGRTPGVIWGFERGGGRQGRRPHRVGIIAAPFRSKSPKTKPFYASVSSHTESP